MRLSNYCVDFPGRGAAGRQHERRLGDRCRGTGPRRRDRPPVRSAVRAPRTRNDLPELGSPANAAVSPRGGIPRGPWLVPADARGRAGARGSGGQRLHAGPSATASPAMPRKASTSSIISWCKDPAINAFAMPGGFVAVNSGLVPRDAQRERTGRRHGARNRARHAAHIWRAGSSTNHARPGVGGRHAGRHPARARPRDEAIAGRHGGGGHRPRKAPRSSIRSTTRAPKNSRPTASASARWRPPATIRSAWRASSRHEP